MSRVCAICKKGQMPETIREDNNGFARYTFEAEFDQLDLAAGWADSDAGFYLNLPTGIKPDDFDGISLSVRPHGHSTLSISAKQYHKNEYHRTRRC